MQISCDLWLTSCNNCHASLSPSLRKTLISLLTNWLFILLILNWKWNKQSSHGRVNHKMTTIPSLLTAINTHEPFSLVLVRGLLVFFFFFFLFTNAPHYCILSIISISGRTFLVQSNSRHSPTRVESMLPMAEMLVKAWRSFVSITLVSWLLVKAHFNGKVWNSMSCTMS